MKAKSGEKNVPEFVRDKGQYALVFGAIALMLYAAGFPIFLLFFVGVLTFFIWKVFSSQSRNETRRIFEFYLSANEILREDERRWYGFEILETIRRGENIIQFMGAVPPLVHFALGSLYQKVNDHNAAVKHFSCIAGDQPSDESAIVFPTKDFREYVEMLRKIERTPAEAPLTSAAIRSLERARKNKGKQQWEYSLSRLANDAPQLSSVEEGLDISIDAAFFSDSEEKEVPGPAKSQENGETRDSRPLRLARSVVQRSKKTRSAPADRKSISEVLHEVYDNNLQ